MSLRPRLIPLLATLLCIPFPARRAAACDCDLQTPRQALASAKFAFSGQVTAVKRDVNGLIVTIRVDRVWKGDVGKEAVVRTAAGGAACGVDFKKGVTYFVYAYPDDHDARALFTDICTRTRPIADAKEDVAVHGKGNAPREARD